MPLAIRRSTDPSAIVAMLKSPAVSRQLRNVGTFCTPDQLLQPVVDFLINRQTQI
jgi:hypothetical protein